jgi:hypothetical protein
MTKDQLVAAITSINRSAAIEFLMSFDVRDLRQYLDHLELTREPRGRDSKWRRADGASAMSMA